MKIRNSLILLLLLLVTAILAVGPGSAAAKGLKPGNVTFYVSEIEVKGATDGIPAPKTDPTTLSKGYGFTPPGKYDPAKPNKWQVSTYMFNPAAMAVNQGDTVTLRIFVVNGDKHINWVEAPDGTVAVKEHISNRGREYIITFKAKQAGYYTLRCDHHDPTMRAIIFSVPSS
ncbi:MAG: hypothetical protein Q8P24_10560 [Desulfobacterales bacterium]|nr:hypothetical protein [Desulfobacterales bacterium]